MDFEKLAEAAAHGQKPEGLTLEEIAVWYPLRDLYAGFRAGQIGAEAARKKKAGLLDYYSELMRKRREEDEFEQRMISLWTRIEYSAREYAANPTIENADRFYATVYGLPRGIGTAGNAS